MRQGRMKLPFKSAGISTIVHATESEEKLEKALQYLIPEETEIEKSEAEGHYGDSIEILSADIERRPHLREFWDKLLDKLSEEDKKWLAKNAVSRIADDCRLYLRFDKQHIISEGKLKISDTGEVIHVRINVSAYPAKKENAVKEMEEFLKSGLDYD